MPKPTGIKFNQLLGQYHQGHPLGLGFGLRIERLGAESRGAQVTYLDFFGLCLVVQGRGTHRIDSVPYEMARGDVYVILPGTSHSWAEMNGLSIVMVHFGISVFSPDEMAALTAETGFRRLFLKDPSAGNRGGRWLHLTPAQQAETMRLIGEIRDETAACSPAGNLLARSLFFRLLVHLSRLADDPARPAARNPATTGMDSQMANALTYIEENFAGPLRLGEAAKLGCLSPDRYTRVFARSMGCTPRAYIRHLRIERAKALLVATDMPIGRVGLESGFAEAPYFARAFRESSGLSPSAYRAKARHVP